MRAPKENPRRTIATNASKRVGAATNRAAEKIPKIVRERNRGKGFFALLARGMTRNLLAVLPAKSNDRENPT